MDSFKIFIEEESLIEKNDRILVALSGGPDSVALTRKLLEISEEYRLSFGFCHVNHMLRGEASDGDEEFCKRLVQKYNGEFYSLKANIEAYSKEKKMGLEEAGRQIRYNYFEKISKENGYNKIALAHNLDDNVETFLFRLMRGTGIHGLKGIPVKRGTIIRPLLYMKKNEILDYLDKIGQSYRIDESNNEKVYTRNKIRLELIPYIEKEFNPKFKESINTLLMDFNNLKEKSEFLENEINVSEINKLEKNEKSLAIYQFLKYNKIDANRNKVEEIINILDSNGQKEISLGKGMILKKSYDLITIEEIRELNAKKDKIQLDIPDKIGYNGYIIEAKIVNRIIKEENCFYFDYEKLELPLWIRTKQDGDKFLPVGMDNYKKLKKFFIDEKVNKEKREEIPLILSGDEILLIGNIRTSSIGNLTENSNKILLLKIEEGVFSE